MKTEYNPWPLGKIPKKWQRPEIRQLEEELGRKLTDPREAVTLFEESLANYVGSKYAVAVDSCTNALFLCLKFCGVRNAKITIPKNTYMSVPQTILNAGNYVEFDDIQWEGGYALKPWPIYDFAARMKKDMAKPFVDEGFVCTSFQIKKIIPIGKGGMIFTNNERAYNYFKAASFEGRHYNAPYDEDQFEPYGWNMYMTPEDAARGLLLFTRVLDDNTDMADWSNYPDLSEQPCFSEVAQIKRVLGPDHWEPNEPVYF